MERNIKIVLEYEGTAYHGWQFQDNQVTVQGELEKAIYQLSGETLRVTGSGRTDAGVHARGQVVNFKSKCDLPLHNMLMGLNSYLPEDIKIRTLEEAPADFNARFQAKQRVYHYYMTTERSAISRNFSWFFFQPFDGDMLHRLAAQLIGQHDFGAFSRLKIESDHKCCIVYESQWTQDDYRWKYRIAANRFLHGMVRTIVGTMMDTARGRFSEAQFREIFESRDRTAAGPAAPAKGLFLEEVTY